MTGYKSGKHPGPRQELRVQLRKDVSAMAYVSFGLDSLGRTTYAYTLANQPDAKQDLGFFSLPVPSPGSNLPSTAVSSISVSQNAPIILGSTGWAPTVPQPEKGIVRLSWSQQPGSTGIRVGGILSGFVIASALKPGFVGATVKGISMSPNLGALNVPSRVHQALTALEDSGFNERTVLTIGPQFPSGTNLLRIISNFREGMVVLEQHGYLKGTSPFTAEAIEVLTRYLDGAKFAGDGPASDYVPPSLAFQSKPAAGLETQIYEAMKLSLGVK